MALKKSQLYSSLWASCDELRGKTNIGEGIKTIIARLAEAHLTEYVDEHTGDEGLLSDVVNDKGALVKGDLKSRRKTISDDPEFEDEREALSRAQTLAETVQPLPAER
jgi:hypothetical protein